MARPDAAVTAFSLHDLSDEQFEGALRDELRERGLSARTAVVRAGKEAFEKFARHQPDGTLMILDGVGWIGIELDVTMDKWAAAVVERSE